MFIGLKEITNWHKERGWLTCGYHFTIDRDARLEVGRQEEAIGAGVRGHNTNSIHICVIGGIDGKNKPEDNFTIEQYNTLRNTLLLLRSRYPNTEIVAHNELDKKKACPSFDVDAFLKVIKLDKQPTKPTKYLT